MVVYKHSLLSILWGAFKDKIQTRQYLDCGVTNNVTDLRLEYLRCHWLEVGTKLLNFMKMIIYMFGAPWKNYFYNAQLQTFFLINMHNCKLLVIKYFASVFCKWCITLRIIFNHMIHIARVTQSPTIMYSFFVVKSVTTNNLIVPLKTMTLCETPNEMCISMCFSLPLCLNPITITICISNKFQIIFISIKIKVHLILYLLQYKSNYLHLLQYKCNKL